MICIQKALRKHFTQNHVYCSWEKQIYLLKHFALDSRASRLHADRGRDQLMLSIPKELLKWGTQAILHGLWSQRPDLVSPLSHPIDLLTFGLGRVTGKSLSVLVGYYWPGLASPTCTRAPELRKFSLAQHLPDLASYRIWPWYFYTSGKPEAGGSHPPSIQTPSSVLGLV